MRLRNKLELVTVLASLIGGLYTSEPAPERNEHTYTDTTPSEAAQQAKLAAAEAKRARKRARNLAQGAKR